MPYAKKREFYRPISTLVSNSLSQFANVSLIELSIY